MNVKKEIGLRLKRAREAHEWTREDVAVHTRDAISASRLGNYEQGTREPDIETIRLLARILDCPASYLACLDDDSIKMPSIESSIAARSLDTLPEEVRRQFCNMLATIEMALQGNASTSENKAYSITHKGRTHKKPRRSGTG